MRLPRIRCTVIRYDITVDGKCKAETADSLIRGCRPLRITTYRLALLRTEVEIPAVGLIAVPSPIQHAHLSKFCQVATYGRWFTSTPVELVQFTSRNRLASYQVCNVPEDTLDTFLHGTAPKNVCQIKSCAIGTHALPCGEP